jgi:hypothetical protein
LITDTTAANGENGWVSRLYFYSLFFSSLSFSKTIAKGMGELCPWEMQLGDTGCLGPNGAA